jgi:hypothetical protein
VKERKKNCNDVTLLYDMGFVGVCEDSSNGAASAILDKLLKFGVFVYDQDETWSLHWFAKLHQLYCVGNRKTIENSSAFVNIVSNCYCLRI